VRLKHLALRYDRTAATITVLASDEQVASRGPTTCPGRDRTAEWRPLALLR
jgi:hypothetical protein